MPLKTLVKVGKITNLSDARYCAGMNVDMLGFRVVEGTDGYVSPAEFQEIRGWFSGPRVVAEVYGLRSTEQFHKILADYRPDIIELSQEELSSVDTNLPLLFRSDGAIPAKSLYGIITSQPKDTRKPAGVLLFTTVDDPARLNELLDQHAVDGIVLSGTAETSPGLKDYDHLADVLEKLEVE